MWFVCKLVSTGNKQLVPQRDVLFALKSCSLIKAVTTCILQSENCTNGQILTQTLVCLAASDWVVANEELTPANRYCIKNLTAGDLLLARVVAVNPGGRSEPGTLAEPVPIREVVGK